MYRSVKQGEDAQLLNSMELARLPHSIGVFGSFAVFAYLLLTFMAFAALAEILRASFMNLNAWMGVAGALVGLWVLPAVFGGFGRMQMDRSGYTSKGALTAGQHYAEMWIHVTVTSALKIMIAVFIFVFEAQHSKANIHTFNHTRYSNDGLIPTGQIGMHIQWTAAMMLVIFTWAISTVTMSMMLLRFKKPVLRASYSGDVDM